MLAEDFASYRKMNVYEQDNIHHHMIAKVSLEMIVGYIHTHREQQAQRDILYMHRYAPNS